jgi:trk system potassium uptake protein TrkH
MNLRAVLHVSAALVVFEGISMLPAAAFSWYYGGGDLFSLLATFLLCLISGGVVFYFTRDEIELRMREGFAVVVFGWTLMAAFGALPFVLSRAIPSYTDAFFETMSGFSTTGASILNNVEALPHGLLFWRSLTHWIGGMGIIVLSLAILPYLGIGGMQLYKAEVPGPIPDKLSPRIKETAKILWGVYLLISALETVLLMFGGMSLFDALCHTFGTVATGGFSTRNLSIAAFDSLYIEIVVMVFMVLAGTNFSLHYRVLKGDWKAYFRDREFLFYIKLLVFFTLVLTPIVFFSTTPHLGKALRSSVFQVISIVTTTGFCTDDFELWAEGGQLIILLLMFVGGCAASTGGSVKIIRIMLLFKHSVNEIKKVLHPNAYLPVRLGGRVVSEEVVTNILAFFLLYLLIFVFGTVAMALVGLDLITAISSVAATLGNVGPGLASVGPMNNYAEIPSVGKWLLSFFMMLGRLELYTVIVVLLPDFWER